MFFSNAAFILCTELLFAVYIYRNIESKYVPKNELDMYLLEVLKSENYKRELSEIFEKFNHGSTPSRPKRQTSSCAKGDKGEPGWNGSFGDKGDQGPPGLKGEKGPKGEDGNPGIPGNKGEPGLQGKDGVKGEQGSPGPRGEKGDKGIEGIKGEQGFTGPEGIKGDRGESGPPGKDGVVGLKGEMGLQGPSGPPGPIGVKGPKGERGVSGAEDFTNCKIRITPYNRNIARYYRVVKNLKQQNDSLLFDFTFSIMSPCDVYVILAEYRLAVKGDAYDILLGPNESTYSYIQRLKHANIRHQQSEINHKIAQKVRSFWLRVWKNGLVEVGRRDEETPFVTFKDAHPLSIQYLKINSFVCGYESIWYFDCGTNVLIDSNDF